MAFYSFITDRFVKKQRQPKKEERKVMSIGEMMEELGVRTAAVIGTYKDEEKPDSLTIDTYLQMQDNDGTIKAITRIFMMPIQANDIKILPGKNDKGERDFIETVFMKPQHSGGMTTSLPFIIADMTRAITEGFRLYEKVPHIIPIGKYKGLIGWKKLAPREAKTIFLRVDEHGGFNGARQVATFGTRTVNIDIPPEKCVLFTFQKERHPLYGESILKTAYYHYDKKHKLYYLAHKKAEIDAVGLKILRISKPLSDAEVKSAETAVDEIGINSRVTLPSGFELDIDRSPTGYDVLKLIEHHDTQIALSTLTQAMQLGARSTYAYPYGKGFETQGAYIIQMLESVMKNMENTLNEWAVAPLIDWNFGTDSYPTIKLMPTKAKTQAFMMKIFETLVKKDPEKAMTPAFAKKLADEVAETLGIEMDDMSEPDGLKAFESGKRKAFDEKKKPALPTPEAIKKKLREKAIQLKDDVYFLEKFETMGKKYAIDQMENK